MPTVHARYVTHSPQGGRGLDAGTATDDRNERSRIGRGRRQWHTWLIAAIASLALAAVWLATPSSGFGASTPRCSTLNLRVDKVGEDDFTSHRSWDLALRNVGSTTCHLNGYPGVALLDSGARFMHTTVNHVAGPPHDVVLPPWHRAFFSFTFVTSGPCTQAVVAYGVQIVPPTALQRLVWYAGKFDLCGPAPARVSVSPVTATRPF
jgi:Protein of unknown function (DUF4232)